MDSREYDQLDALSSSSNVEIGRLSVIIKDLKERVESLERNQTDLMDNTMSLKGKYRLARSRISFQHATCNRNLHDVNTFVE